MNERRSVTFYLAYEDWERLAEIARSEYRPVKAQAAYLLVNAIRRYPKPKPDPDLPGQGPS